MPTNPRITTNRAIMGGKPYIHGMRVTVGAIHGLLDCGETHADILAAYPYLESEDIIAVEEYFRELDASRKE